jgi:hypothetical protein
VFRWEREKRARTIPHNPKVSTILVAATAANETARDLAMRSVLAQQLSRLRETEGELNRIRF